MKEDKTESFTAPVVITLILLAYAFTTDGGYFETGIGMFSIPIVTLWLGFLLGRGIKQ